MPLLGQLALWLALLLGLWGAVVGFAGYRHDRPDLQESARRATVVLAATLFVAVLSLFVAALRRDFQVAYIAAHADLTLARRDAVAVLLDGVAGRLLVGGCALTGLLTAARHFTPAHNSRALAYVTGLGAGVVTAIIATMLFAVNPFVLQSYTPVDGQGLSQRLYDLDARLDLALRCLAYSTAVIALLWFLTARLVARGDAGWQRRVHAWILVAWVLLTAELGLSFCVALRQEMSTSALVVLWRPALALWVTLGVLLHRRRVAVGLAAHVTHVGAVLIAVSVVATTLGTTETVRLRPGESATVDGYALTYLAASFYPARNQIITQGLLAVRRDDRALGRIAVVRRQQLDAFGNDRFAPARRAGRWSGMAASVYVHWAADSSAVGAADFVVAVVPLARWLWVGFWVLALGGLAALVVRRDRDAEVKVL